MIFREAAEAEAEAGVSWDWSSAARAADRRCLGCHQHPSRRPPPLAQPLSSAQTEYKNIQHWSMPAHRSISRLFTALLEKKEKKHILRILSSSIQCLRFLVKEPRKYLYLFTPFTVPGSEKKERLWVEYSRESEKERMRGYRQRLPLAYCDFVSILNKSINGIYI